MKCPHIPELGPELEEGWEGARRRRGSQLEPLGAGARG